jgi:hypothetical protein
VVEGWRTGLDLEWAFDLISSDPARRAAARDRHRETVATHAAAEERINELWRRTGSLRPAEPGLAADMDQRISAKQDAYQYLLSGAIFEFEGFRRLDCLPYALLFLEWEAKYPAEWPRWWGAKKKVLRGLCQFSDHPLDVRRRLSALVIQAVCREHRCEDAGYASLGRKLADDDLTGLLWTISETAGRENVRRRAAFVLYLIREAHVPCTLATWQNWLRAQTS